MSLESIVEQCSHAMRVLPILKRELGAWLAGQSDPQQTWVRASGFSAEAHEICRIPGDPLVILFGLGEKEDRWSYSSLPLSLPEGIYRLDRQWEEASASRAALSWAVGAYQFTRYKSQGRKAATLCWPENANRAGVARDVRAIALARDLINTPANDLGPAELADLARDIALKFGGDCRVTIGRDLIIENYPLIHAVGKASKRAPRLIDLHWGELEAPKVTVVGKGVCFDTGGLNLKARGPMSIMKLDMGGAAHALALAQMIMESELPVRLRVLIPAV